MKYLAFMVLSLIAQDIRPPGQLHPDITRWESAIGDLEILDRTEAEIRDGILFYGSSSIRLWNEIKDDMAPWPALQRGYGGAKLPDVIHFAPRILGPHLVRTNPRRCKAVVIFVANDIDGSPDEDPSPQIVAGRFARLLRYIRSLDADIPVFWIEVTPTHRRWSVWPVIEEASRQIRYVMDPDPNAHFIHTAGAFPATDGKPASNLFLDDRLHLNRDGYELWSSLVKTALYARLGSPQPWTGENGAGHR